MYHTSLSFKNHAHATPTLQGATTLFHSQSAADIEKYLKLMEKDYWKLWILDFSTSKSSFSVNTFIIPNCLFICLYILECTNRAKMDNYLPGEEKISSEQGSISKFCSNEDVFEVKFKIFRWNQFQFR